MTLRLVCSIMFVALLLEMFSGEKVTYISTERPSVTYLNTAKLASYFNVTSRRFGRSDPFYYVDIKTHILYTLNNNLSVHFYFYEFLSNSYRRGFVEMHFRFCDLIEKDMFFGSALRQGKFQNGCPFPAGDYFLYNMTIPLKHIPHNFPFQKGRIYCNTTTTSSDEILFSGHIDMEIKEAHIKTRNN